MVYRIRKYGDPVLETPAAPVDNFGSAELQQLVDDMFETMYAHKGVGLAATQVGVSLRLAVIENRDAVKDRVMHGGVLSRGVAHQPLRRGGRDVHFDRCGAEFGVGRGG